MKKVINKRFIYTDKSNNPLNRSCISCIDLKNCNPENIEMIRDCDNYVELTIENMDECCKVV